MKRRQSLKVIGIGSISAGLLLDACKPDTKEEKKVAAADGEDTSDRMKVEIEKNKKLNAEKFFTAAEMATITVLGDIIIPKDDRSGSASDAGVPDFIEFMVKDKPELQVPMRGGLRWLDMQCLKQYKKSFADCSKEEQIAMVDQIAYPEKSKPELKQGVAFFNRMRELTASGFFSSKMGIEDIGYKGNVPNNWEGMPESIVKKYGLENVRFDSKDATVPYKVG